MGPIAVYTKAWRSSGTGLFAQELVKGLLANGQQVIFLSPPVENGELDAPRQGLRRIIPWREQETGAKLKRIGISLGRMAGAALGLARARLATRDFIVSIPDPLLVAAPLLVLLRLTGARITYIVHDPLPHAWRLSPRLRGLENLGYRVAYWASSALVVLSQAGEAVLRAHYRVGTRPVAVIAHGVFLLPETTPVPGEGRLLVFGTLRRNKGVHDAIEGVLAARGAGAAVTLTIAGAPDPVERAYWEACEPLARANPQAIRLSIGFVPQGELDALIEQSDALLLPYRDFHSQSGVAMLAASNARPVLATRSGGLGDLIAQGMPGVVIEPPGSGAEVAEAIRAFLQVPAAEWTGRAAAFRAKVMAGMGWEAIARRYIELMGR